MADTFFPLLFWLLFFHFLADLTGLQGDFLSRLKNRYDALNDPEKQPLGVKNAWLWGLWGHGVIHGGFVFFATGMFWLGVLEVIAHAYIDWLKCEKKINFHQDQWAHIGFKVLWAGIAVSVG